MGAGSFFPSLPFPRRDALWPWLLASLALHALATGPLERIEPTASRASPERQATSIRIRVAAPPSKPRSVEAAPAAPALPPPTVPKTPPPKPAATAARVDPPPAPTAPPVSPTRVEPAVDHAVADPVEPETAAEAIDTAATLASMAEGADSRDPALLERAEARAADRLANYVADVRARIASEKRYPSMARRRSLEGVVVVRIDIGATGEVVSVDVLDGPGMLARATRQAIERAAPFPLPPRGSVSVEVPLRYQLEN